MEFYSRKNKVSRIWADNAIMRFTQKDILFKGNIKLASGSRVLTAGRLRLAMEDAAIRIDGPFEVQTGQDRSSGENLSTGIFLQ